MADAERTQAHTLSALRELAEAPWGYEFLQALRLVECAHPDRPRLGESARPQDDPVRLAQEPELTFAPASIASFQPQKGGLPPRLAVLFFGLLGPNGPLPLHLTEYARSRMREAGDPTFARFLDVFHHRMLSLFYRAWARARPTVEYDRPEHDRYQRWIGSLFGLGMPSLRDRDAAPDFARLFHAGAFAAHTRHAAGLEQLLGDYFGVDVHLREFVGRWLDVPSQYRWRLGGSRDTGTLGLTTVVGSKVWDCQQHFRIELGPMPLDRYLRLLPRSRGIHRLAALVRHYVGDELTWDIRLVLRRDEVPKLQLGADARLGWTTWLLSDEAGHDATDLVLEPLGTGEVRDA